MKRQSAYFFWIFLSFLFELSSTQISLNRIEAQQIAINERDFKKAIEIQLEKICLASDAEEVIDVRELAFLYLKDQDQKRAFETFLKALDLTKPPTHSPAFDATEYKKAFDLYLDSKAESPQVTAKKIIKTLSPILKEKPDQYLLDYFIAIAYANLGKYDEFFTHFYRAYQFFPDHYLAYKTKAVLHIKILERTRGDVERLAQRQIIMDNLLSALQREPFDTTIYRLLISFSQNEKKRNQVQLCLNKIINDNIMIPRGELMFYVIEAIDIQDFELAQRLIFSAKKWYPQSRIVTSAQNYLDAHK